MAIILVPNVTLLPQDKTNGCWYFSAKMMSKWAADNNKTAIKDPATVTDAPANLQQLYEWNSGYSTKTCKQLADRLGMNALDKKQRGFNEFKTLLARGPIWAAGAKGGATGSYHVTVIAGVADTGLLLFDPLPLNVGRKVWRTWAWMDEYFALTNEGSRKNLLVPK
jgi:hypothetical protein